MKIDKKMLDKLSREAAASPRRRKNLNFHPRDDFPAHRLLNAMEPDSYIQPHRHNSADKDESIIVLRGALGVIFFGLDGSVIDTMVLEAGGETLGVDIPHGQYHAMVCLQAGTVFFEAKAGPYLPLSLEEKAPWSPSESESGVDEYLTTLKTFFSRACPILN